MGTSEPSAACSAGKSLRVNWSCRGSVWVEITTRSPLLADASAGIAYASDFPTPVPASATSVPPSANVRSIAAASSRCSARSSYPTTERASGPSLAKVASTVKADDPSRGTSRARGSLRAEERVSNSDAARATPAAPRGTPRASSAQAPTSATLAASRKNSAVAGPSSSAKAAISLRTAAGSSRATFARYPRTRAEVIASSSARCAASGVIAASAARRCSA